MRVANFAVRHLRVAPGPLLTSIIEVTEALNAAAQGEEDTLQMARLLVVTYMRDAGAADAAGTRGQLLRLVSSMLTLVFDRVGACPAPHPAGFNDDLRMVGGALDLASVTLNLAPAELLPSATMETLCRFALAALDADYRRDCALSVLSFFFSLMLLGRLPLDELHGPAAAAPGSVAAAGGLRRGHVAMARQLSGLADEALSPAARAQNGRDPAAAAAEADRARARLAEARGYRPRVVALLTPVAQPLTEVLVRQALSRWPEYALRHDEEKEGVADVLYMLFTQYFPAVDGGMPLWALTAFRAEGVCRERDKPTDAEKLALVARLFAIHEGGAAAPSLSVDHMAGVLLQMHDAARGLLREADGRLAGTPSAAGAGGSLLGLPPMPGAGGRGAGDDDDDEEGEV